MDKRVLKLRSNKGLGFLLLLHLRTLLPELSWEDFTENFFDFALGLGAR